MHETDAADGQARLLFVGQARHSGAASARTRASVRCGVKLSRAAILPRRAPDLAGGPRLSSE